MGADRVPRITTDLAGTLLSIPVEHRRAMVCAAMADMFHWASCVLADDALYAEPMGEAAQEWQEALTGPQTARPALVVLPGGSQAG